MATVNNDYQTNLLFKKFVGVAAARLDDQFSSENFASVPNIFSKDVMIEEIPSAAPLKIMGTGNLDASANWSDSSYNLMTNQIEESIFNDLNNNSNPDNGKTFAEIYPDSKLKFYKRLLLVPVAPNSNGRVWGAFTDYSGVTFGLNKECVLKHTIPFRYDDIDATYSPVVRYNKITSSKGAGSSPYVPNYKNCGINASPLYWVMDAGTGFLQLYATTSELQSIGVKDEPLTSGVQDQQWSPQVSCFVYNGKTGITNLDVSGQVQVGDLSGALGSLEHIDRMILPDGSANILDLCGNDAIRSQYNYVRKNMFIGYPSQPVIDNSNVDHSQDPSLNNIVYELDVSGNSLLRGTLNVSGQTIVKDISGVFAYITDVSAIDISSTNITTNILNVTTKTNVTDLSASAITTTGNTWIGGDLDVDGNLKVDGVIDSFGNTRFVDYRDFSDDISGSQYANGAWHCIATIDPIIDGAFATGLFIIDDDTSGKRQTITFRAGSSYTNGNFIDVVSNNWYAGLSNSNPNATGCPITDIKIDCSGAGYYDGANLYIFRKFVPGTTSKGTAVDTKISIRVYQNRRISSSIAINYWKLTSTPLLFTPTTKTVSQINLVFNEVAGGGSRACKVSTLDTMITGDVSFNNLYISDTLDVIGKSTLTDVSASALTTTGDINVGGDLNVSGNMTYASATFNDLSGINLTLADQLNIKETYILTKNDLPEQYIPTGNPPPNNDYYVIAFVTDSSANPIGTGNENDNVTAYFTFTNNRGRGTAGQDAKQTLHFIAGMRGEMGNRYSPTSCQPFIKVLSNNYNSEKTRVSNIAIAGVPYLTKMTYYLLLGFDSSMTPATGMENCEIRMYKNSYGIQRALSNGRLSGGGWIMGLKTPLANNNTPIATTRDLFLKSNQSLYPASPWSTGYQYLNVRIDVTPGPNAMSTLRESFLNTVDISDNLFIGNNLNVTGTSTINGLTTINNNLNVGHIDCNTITGGDISSNDTLLIQKKSYTIDTADPSGWFLIAECNDLRTINTGKPNMAYTVNNGLFQINATMNWDTGGYNATNRYNQNITFLLGMGQDDRVNINVLSQNNVGSGGTQLTFGDLSIYKDTFDGKFKLWGQYAPSVTLATGKKIFLSSRLQTNNENKGLTQSYQVNWKLIPFTYRSTTPNGTRLHQYNIASTQKPSHIYQSQPLINTDSVIVDGNSVVSKASTSSWPPSATPNAHILMCYAQNFSSSGTDVNLACNGMFKLIAKHSIGGIPYLQEIVFNAAYIFSAVTTANYSQSSSLNLISHTKTRTLISKIRMYHNADTGGAPQVGAQAYIKIVLDTGITSLNGGIELTGYDNDKNDGTGAVNSEQYHWTLNELFNSGSNPPANWLRREIDLTGTEFSQTVFDTDLLASNNLRLGMEDLSSCLITKDENKLPYTPVIVNVEQDGSNNLILQNNNDGAVVINAATRSGTGGGLKIFNSGETTDFNNYTWPEIQLLAYDEDVTPGGTGALAPVSKWATGPGGASWVEGSKSFTFYSGQSQNTQMNFRLGDNSSKSATTAISFGNKQIDSNYPSDFIISLNDNGSTSSRNNVSTYINTPNYHIYNTPKNPAVHIDSDVNKVKFNAPMEVNGGITGTLDVSNVIVNNSLSCGSLTTNVSAILPNNTTITNRGVFGNYKTLKADGYQEFSFDTQNVNPNDWISIAYVGPWTQPQASISQSQSAGGYSQSQKQRADAKFEIINNMSGTHQTICLRASHHFARGQCIDIIKNVRYGNGSKRNIKAFRMAYNKNGIYDGGILQMQIGDDNTSTDQVVIQLKISENWNDYGWFCDINSSPSADNTPLGYNQGVSGELYWTGAGLHGFNTFPNFFPDPSGINVLEREQSYQALGQYGKSTLMYTSDIIANKIYMKDELDMSGNNIDMNGGTINNFSVTMDTLQLKPYITIDDASGALMQTGADGQIAYGELALSDPSQSILIYRGLLNNSTNKFNFIMGSPTRIPCLFFWGGNSSGGTPLSISSGTKRSGPKLGSIVVASSMQEATDYRFNWRPPANGFVSTVAIHDCRMHFEFQNTSGVSQDLTMELWVIDTYKYQDFINGTENPKCRKVGSRTWNIPNGSGGGGNYKLSKAAQDVDGLINLPASKYLYFEGGSKGSGGNLPGNGGGQPDSVYPAVIFRAPFLNSGTITITPMPSTLNNGFTASGVDLFVHMREKVFI